MAIQHLMMSGRSSSIRVGRTGSAGFVSASVANERYRLQGGPLSVMKVLNTVVTELIVWILDDLTSSIFFAYLSISYCLTVEKERGDIWSWGVLLKHGNRSCFTLGVRPCGLRFPCAFNPPVREPGDWMWSTVNLYLRGFSFRGSMWTVPFRTFNFGPRSGWKLPD